jgi:hypothetical protein
MSLLGFDALGRLALGQTRQGGTSIVMPAAAGAFTFSSAPATFKITETASAGAFTFSGKAASLNIGEAAAPGSFTLSLKTATFGRTMSAAVGAFAFTGIDPDEALKEDADPGAFVFVGKAAALERTGYDYEAGYQGIGHYLEERERARRLAAITKKIPGVPIDRRTSPQWEPLRASLAAPIAPAVDMAAVQAERMAAAAAATDAATKRRRRDEEALLLLAC